jgi:hypothetical protein
MHRRPLPARPRVLVLEWNLPFHIDVARRLAECHGWDFVYWVGDGATFGVKVRECFPDIIFHDTVDARYGRPPPELPDLQPHPFDEPMARNLAYEQTLILKMMDRIELEESFGFRERVRLFHHLATWWAALLDHIKPDIMMIPTAPHVVYDYVVYALCRRRGICTAIFENAGIPGMLLPAPEFEVGFPELVAKYRDLLACTGPDEPISLSAHAEAYLATTRGAYVKPHEMTRFERIYALPIRERIAWHHWHNLGKIVHVGRYPLYVAHLFRKLRRSLVWLRYGSANSGRRISGFYHGRLLVLGEGTPDEEARHNRWVTRRLLELRKDYEGRVAPVDLSANFIYLPLHVQPERSTSPNGGIYDHTELVIEALIRSLPRGWLIYVKEHPSQFAPWQIGERGRRFSDYDAITRSACVRLVPLDVNPFDLIDRARAVATITGTAGWEAIAREVPVLCFGIAWYQGCDGVFDVRRLEDLHFAIECVAKGVKPSLNRVRLFLKAVELTGIRAFIDEEARDISDLSEAENIDVLADGLARMINDQVYN